jgi:hypothetical protein
MGKRGRTIRILSGNDVDVEPILYNGPPPSLVPHSLPLIPHLSILVAGIIESFDKLFFASHSLGNQSTRKWRLIRVAFADSVSISPSCLQDGRFLVEFYSLHHDDIWFNSTNQRYWLQYHSLGDITTPSSSSTTHFIRPSDTFEAHASFVVGLISLMEGAIRVKMSANGVSMKSNKYCLAELRWDELQSSVRFGPDDCFPITKNAILNEHERLA